MMNDPSHEAPWANFAITVRGIGAAMQDELIGALVELTGALGASQAATGESDVWRLAYPAGVDRAEIEQAAQTHLLQALDDALGFVSIQYAWEAQQDEHWATAYRQYFQPVEVAGRFRIAAPWHDTDCGTLIPIIINPGQGFGTGTHETTQLCLAAIERLVRPGTTRFLDVGAGSGILSIAAARLGAREVAAVEIDPAANANHRENLALNAVEERITIIEGDATSLGDEMFDLVVCNMLLSNASRLFPALLHHLRPGGRLILAGFLTREADQARALFAQSQGHFEDYSEKNEWGRLVWEGQ